MRGHGVECLNALLSSVYQQTFRDYAIVISDNSSGSDILRYVDSLPDPFRKTICYTKNPGAKTIPVNLNHAMHHASGELVKVLLQDDAFVRSDALQIIADAYRQNPGAKWCLEACVHTSDFQKFWRLMVPSFNEFLIVGNNTISSPSVLSFKRELDPSFDVNLKLLTDVEFYFRQRMAHGEPLIVPTPLIANRVWTGQTQRSISAEEQFAELVHIANKYPTVVDAAYVNRAKQHFAARGDGRTAGLLAQLESRAHQ